MALMVFVAFTGHWDEMTYLPEFAPD